MSATQSDALQLADASGAAGADDVLVVHTWDGTIIIQTATERIEVPAASTLAIAVVDGKITFLPAPPAFLTTGSRPDQASIDPSTFDPKGPTPERGLYVWVRDGAVTLAQGGQVVELKAGSAARVTDQIATLGADPQLHAVRFHAAPGRRDPAADPALFPRARRLDHRHVQVARLPYVYGGKGGYGGKP